MPISEYDGANGTSSDDVGCFQRDRRAAAPRDLGAVAGGGAAGGGVGRGVGDDSAGSVQAPAGAQGGRVGAGPEGGQAAPLWPRGREAAAGSRVDRALAPLLYA